MEGEQSESREAMLQGRSVVPGPPLGGYAQTNIQLLNQLNAAGYSEKDLVAVKDAYRLAVSLFSAKYRPSGKSLLAHLVGTASILASLRTPAETVIVGLLHAAYLLGDFGFGSRSGRRNWLRQRVGPEIESHLNRYREFRWTESSIQDLSSRVSELDSLGRQIVLVRLANALEDYQDVALAYCRKAEAAPLLKRSIPVMVNLAEALGYPDLAVELRRAAEATAAARVPASIRDDRQRTYVVVPLSYRRKLTAVAWSMATRTARAIRG